MIMRNKLTFEQSNGTIVFIGGMNAMPMMYALELKKLGFDVLYIVDAPSSDWLSRPENHFKTIEYPYPDWIIEFKLKTQVLVPLFQYYYGMRLKSVIAKSCESVQAIFTNGLFTALTPFLHNVSNVIALSHGADLDSWADVEGANDFSNSACKQSFFKYLPKPVSKFLIAKVVKRQYNGFLHASTVIYFPRGFNKIGDRVIRKLVDNGVEYLERYDVSFDPLEGQARGLRESDGKLVVFSGVRFLYKSFSDGNEEYNKGNDIIIAGLARFYQEYPELEVHFVEKGNDVGNAKLLVEKMGLSNAVTWHKEMKFFELIKLYQKADICFDQVGKHWIGAIGFYSLWLGKPLIANDNLPVKLGVWPAENPIASADSTQAVYESLVNLSNEGIRKTSSDLSKDFAETYLGPKKLLANFLQ